MSRQKRRSAAKPGQDGAPKAAKAARAAPAVPAASAAPAASLVEGLFTSARHFHQAGQFAEAETLYRRALQMDPRHVDSMGFLGGLALQSGRAQEAAGLLGQALTLAPRSHLLHFNMAAAFRALGRLGDAITHYKTSIHLQPNQPAAYNNIGRALHDAGRLAEAAAAYDRALGLAPDPRVYCNLGNVRLAQGAFAEALACYERAGALAPAMAEPPNGVGSVLLRQDRPELALAPLQRALSLRANFVEAHNNLARALLGCGNAAAALAAIRTSLAIADTPEARALFVTCATAAPIPADAARFAPLLHRAIDERWGRPGDLAAIATQIAVRAEPLASGILRAEQAWPERLKAADLFGPPGLAAIASDRSLQSVLEAAPICDRGLERFLTSARRVLLGTATAQDGQPPADGELAFWCALAQQCFANEHVFDDTPHERALVDGLRASLIAALQSGAAIPPLWPVALAAYQPLAVVAGAARLLDRTWPAGVAALLTRHVGEPLEEQQIRSTIPRATPISDAVSRSVQEQYEENPYPRWIAAATPNATTTLGGRLARLFPRAAIPVPGTPDGHDVLIAGCGTGQHAIEVGRMLQGARVLAVDLSLASLAFAKRQSAALGVANVEYAQADLLELGSLGRSFDLIEASGVLHHLADPMAGWRALLTVLRPGGVMSVGLYSALARRDVADARSFIAEQGFQPAPADMRRCRQVMFDADDDTPLRRLSRSPDFARMSGVRDMLFHVREHRLTLPDIAAFLAANGLGFLGFDLVPGVALSYRQQFPDDPAMTDLRCWDSFEQEHPDLFAGMYSFWVQKT